MFDRAVFLKSVASVFATAAVPTRAPSALPSPLPSSTDDDDGLCTQNNVLPYDKPLLMKMRVLDGPDLDLFKYRGELVWLNIFATWCGPCNHEQADVVTLAKKYYDKGLRVIGVNVQERDDAVRAYRTKYSIPYPIAMDETGDFTNNMESQNGGLSFPAHLLIDRNGYLSCFISGSLSVDDVESEIVTLLGPAPSLTPKPA